MGVACVLGWLGVGVAEAGSAADGEGVGRWQERVRGPVWGEREKERERDSERYL